MLLGGLRPCHLEEMSSMKYLSTHHWIQRICSVSRWEFLNRRPILVALILLRAISILKLFRMMARASFRRDVNYAQVKRTVLEPSLT